MLKALVECRPNEDPCIQGPTCMTLVHGLVSMTLIPHGMQPLADIVHLDISERGSITFASLKHSHLSQDTFNQLCDGHSGWDGVGVDNDVRDDALACEWHVFLAVAHSNGTFLPMPRSL